MKPKPLRRAARESRAARRAVKERAERPWAIPPAGRSAVWQTQPRLGGSLPEGHHEMDNSRRSRYRRHCEALGRWEDAFVAAPSGWPVGAYGRPDPRVEVLAVLRVADIGRPSSCGEQAGLLHDLLEPVVELLPRPWMTSVQIVDEHGEEAAELARLLDEADVPTLARQSRAPAPGADQFKYTLTVESEDERHELTLAQSQVLADLPPLIKRLERRAMEDRRRR